MNTSIKVVRFHLVERLNYVIIPLGALTLSFAINLAIFAAAGYHSGPHRSGGVVTIFCFLFVAGLLTMTRSLPFGLALGLSRRSYYAGTVLLAVILSASDALVLAVMQALERATGGWGEQLDYFRVGWILDGPWYLTWLTAFVGLILLFVYGTWFGLVYRRWNWYGLVAFGGAQTCVLAAAAIVITWTRTWTHLAHLVGGLNVPSLTGVLAVVAAALLAGGLVTLRRVSV